MLFHSEIAAVLALALSMDLKIARKLLYALITVASVIIAVPVSGAISSSGTHKTFAIFIAAYNPQTGEARGGVGGTAFFMSQNEAITAYHVVRPETFVAKSSGEKVFVWLVHENEPAIVISPKDVVYFSDRDLTKIFLPKGSGVSKKFVFKRADHRDVDVKQVHTEGFIANSGGPQVSVIGDNLVVNNVPTLARIQSEGERLRRAPVELRAVDVNLRGISCFELSYQPIVGLSGGPVLVNGRVIGMNSFADPQTRSKTWAVDLSTF